MSNWNDLVYWDIHLKHSRQFLKIAYKVFKFWLETILFSELKLVPVPWNYDILLLNILASVVFESI